jgi:hypothetical protein
MRMGSRNHARVQRAPFRPGNIQRRMLLGHTRAAGVLEEHALVQEHVYITHSTFPHIHRVVVLHGEHVEAVIVVYGEWCMREGVRLNGASMADDSADGDARGGGRKMECSEVRCLGSRRVGSYKLV